MHKSMQPNRPQISNSTCEVSLHKLKKAVVKCRRRPVEPQRG